MISKSLALIAFFSIILFQAFSQGTGSFNTSVNFNTGQRTLSCYVPTNYDSTGSYQLLIGLHGLGDNSANYRNALMNLGWTSALPNTIFVCPDGGDDQGKDFYVPDGDEAIIQECINYALQHYAIDVNNIVLQGFSLGGRSALKYGLDHPNEFAGLLLNTPAIQGKSDAFNDPNSGVIYAYENASQIPIFSMVGSDDFLYVDNGERAYRQLLKNDGLAQHHVIDGLDHTIPGTTFLQEAMDFFIQPTTQDFDLEALHLETTTRVCNGPITATFAVRNRGAAPVTAFEVNYTLGSTTGSTTWTGNIGAYEYAEVSLTGLNPANGTQDLSVTIGAINTSSTDPDPTNNQTETSLEVVDQPVALPYFHGFEAEDPNLLLGDDPSVFQWVRDDEVGVGGDGSFFAFNTILVFPTKGNIESFHTPVMDLSTATEPVLSFDVAFNYHRYTPPIFLIDTVFADTLIVSISTDCGATYQELYRKGGADLATVSQPIQNPLNLQSTYFTPTADDWRRDSIDLTAFQSATEAIIQFSYLSDLGGSINIDNIEVEEDLFIQVEEVEATAAINLYPNPATDQVTIQPDQAFNGTITILDAVGRSVHIQQSNLLPGQPHQLDVSALAPGWYQVTLQDDQTRQAKRLLVTR